MDLVILQDVLQRCNVLDAVMVVQMTSVRLLLHLTILGVGYPIITYRFHVRPDRLTSIFSICELKNHRSIIKRLKLIEINRLRPNKSKVARYV